MRLRLPPVRALWPAKGLRAALALNLILGAGALAGLGWAYQLVSGPSATSNSTTTAGGRPVDVTRGSVVSTATATGAVQSANTAAADFVTSGTVTSIAVKVGDTVAKDQVLANVNPSDAQAALNNANANLTAAQASLSRATAAADDASIATAQAQVTSAQGTVDAANRALAGTTLRAPIAGTVTAVNGSVGGSASGSGSSSSSGASGSGGAGGGSATGGSASSSTTASSSGFIQLADLSQLQVSASFAETDATKLKTGLAATVTWAALPNTTATAKVATISPTATTANNVNSYGVVVSLDQIPSGVRIGQTVTVKVTVAQVDNVIRVPTAAVRTAGATHLVTVVGTPNQTRTVQVGVQGDTFIEITSGLDVGTQVLIVVATTGTTGPGGAGGLGGGGLGGGGGGFGGGGAGAGGGARGGGAG